MGAFFRFLGLCVCLGVQQGLGRVLIKYSGNVRSQISISFLSYMLKHGVLRKLKHIFPNTYQRIKSIRSPA